jgi:hypothetical protein
VSTVIRQPLFVPQFNERSTFALIKAKAANSGQPSKGWKRGIFCQMRNAFPPRWQPKYSHAFARFRARIIRPSPQALVGKNIPQHPKLAERKDVAA